MNAWNAENVAFEFQVALELAKIAILKKVNLGFKNWFLCF